jgi:hypothetical protein
MLRRNADGAGVFPKKGPSARDTQGRFCHLFVARARCRDATLRRAQNPAMIAAEGPSCHHLAMKPGLGRNRWFFRQFVARSMNRGNGFPVENGTIVPAQRTDSTRPTGKWPGSDIWFPDVATSQSTHLLN